MDKIHIKFLNLNELEFTEANSIKLLERGYRLRANSFTAVKNSRKTAFRIIKFAEKCKLNIDVHFCPVEVKDRYQTSLRLFRKAYNIAENYEVVSDEGTIIRAMLIDKRNKIKEVFDDKVILNSLIQQKNSCTYYAAPYLVQKFYRLLMKKGVDIKYIEYLPVNFGESIKNIL